MLDIRAVAELVAKTTWIVLNVQDGCMRAVKHALARIPPRIIEPASTILPHFLDHEEALKQGHNVFPFSWHSQKS
jgi:hypothetical protein